MGEAKSTHNYNESSLLTSSSSSFVLEAAAASVVVRSQSRLELLSNTAAAWKVLETIESSNDNKKKQELQLQQQLESSNQDHTQSLNQDDPQELKLVGNPIEHLTDPANRVTPAVEIVTPAVIGTGGSHANFVALTSPSVSMTSRSESWCEQELQTHQQQQQQNSYGMQLQSREFTRQQQQQQGIAGEATRAMTESGTQQSSEDEEHLDGVSVYRNHGEGNSRSVAMSMTEDTDLPRDHPRHQDQHRLQGGRIQEDDDGDEGPGYCLYDGDSGEQVAMTTHSDAGVRSPRTSFLPSFVSKSPVVKKKLIVARAEADAADSHEGPVPKKSKSDMISVVTTTVNDGDRNSLTHAAFLPPHSDLGKRQQPPPSPMHHGFQNHGGMMMDEPYRGYGQQQSNQQPYHQHHPSQQQQRQPMESNYHANSSRGGSHAPNMPLRPSRGMTPMVNVPRPASYDVGLSFLEHQHHQQYYHQPSSQHAGGHTLPENHGGSTHDPSMYSTSSSHHLHHTLPREQQSHGRLGGNGATSIIRRAYSSNSLTRIDSSLSTSSSSSLFAAAAAAAAVGPGTTAWSTNPHGPASVPVLEQAYPQGSRVGVVGGVDHVSTYSGLSSTSPYHDLVLENHHLKTQLDERDRSIMTLQQQVVELQDKIAELRQLPTGKISQIPVEDMIEIMQLYGSEVSDTVMPPRKSTVQKASIVRQFRRWNPNFFQYFQHINGKWVPKLGKEGEMTRRIEARRQAALQKSQNTNSVADSKTATSSGSASKKKKMVQQGKDRASTLDACVSDHQEHEDGCKKRKRRSSSSSLSSSGSSASSGSSRVAGL